MKQRVFICTNEEPPTREFVGIGPGGQIHYKVTRGARTGFYLWIEDDPIHEPEHEEEPVVEGVDIQVIVNRLVLLGGTAFPRTIGEWVKK